MLLRLVERDEPPSRTGLPQRGLVVVEDVRAHPGAAPSAQGVEPREPVLRLEVREDLRGRDGALARERADNGASRFACSL